MAAVTGETAYLARRDGGHAIYVAAAESDRAIRHTGGLGRRVPLGDTAIGQAFDDIGSIAVRRDAVEPDITALIAELRAVVDGPGPDRYLAPELAAAEQLLAKPHDGST